MVVQSIITEEQQSTWFKNLIWKETFVMIIIQIAFHTKITVRIVYWIFIVVFLAIC